MTNREKDILRNYFDTMDEYAKSQISYWTEFHRLCEETRKNLRIGGTNNGG